MSARSGGPVRRESAKISSVRDYRNAVRAESGQSSYFPHGLSLAMTLQVRHCDKVMEPYGLQLFLRQGAPDAAAVVSCPPALSAAGDAGRAPGRLPGLTTRCRRCRRRIRVIVLPW